MDDPDTTSKFMEQFTGSASANLVCVVVVMIGLAIKKLCARESKCKTHVHCCCLDLDLRDKTIRSKELPKIEDSPELGESNV